METVTSPDRARSITVDTRYFAAALAAVIPASCAADSYPLLSGVLVQPDGDRLRFFSTDRYRLHAAEIPIRAQAERPPAPAVYSHDDIKTIAAMAKGLPTRSSRARGDGGSTPEQIEISCDADGSIVSLGNPSAGTRSVRVGSHEIAAQFPQISKVIDAVTRSPESGADDVMVNPRYLVDAMTAATAVQRAEKLAGRLAKSPAVRMIVRGQKRAISVAYDEEAAADWAIRFVALLMPLMAYSTSIGDRAMESIQSIGIIGRDE